MKTLIVVDYQNDFASPNGSLYVKDGDKILRTIKLLMQNNFFDRVIATKDLHPQDHCSFIENGGSWTQHCVAGTKGAELYLQHGDSNLPVDYEADIEYVIHKGRNPDVDSYSAFYDNDRKHYTGLGELTKGSDVYICGLAYDYCVKFTAIDALEFSDNVFIITDAVKAVEQDEEKVRLLRPYLDGKGIKFVTSDVLK